MESTQGLPLEVRLSAYLDGQLPHAEITEIDRMLARDEKARTLFNRLKLGSDLGRRAFEDMLHEPVPLDLVRSIKQASADAARDVRRPKLVPPVSEAAPRRKRTRFAAAALALLVTGGCAGYLLGALQAPVVAPLQAGEGRNWLDDISVYHRVHSRQTRHLAEVPAAEDRYITEWLSSAVGVSFRLPDLGGSRLTFEGARLLVAGGRPTGQLLYRNEDGEVLAVYFQKSDPIPERTDLTDTIRNDLGLISWREGAANYVVVGASADPALEAIATTVAQTI